ncbi:hypothetical protein [Paenarthrobacter sp. NPDC057981]|uniref:hypothetical protein n=1 Tax=Paenarthrobacter sp. NPDC057981 TaxID=3346297 RepID=UPI0036DB2302
MFKIPVGQVRGFYYAGSWGTSGLDLWQHHDRDAMAVEIARGKEYFPGWNVARWFLSHEAYKRDPEKFLANFEAGVATFDRHGIQVQPTLFNRWRDPICDFGGVSLEHIIPGVGNCQPDFFTSTEWADPDPYSVQQLFGDFINAVVGTYATDDRIHSWDICNEPLMIVADPESPLRQAELRWLSWCADMCRAAGATQPLTIGCNPNLSNMEATEPFVDFLTFHPYYIPTPRPGRPVVRVGTREGFEGFLDEAVELAQRTGKDLLANETVWGATEDAEHVEIMRYTLGELTKRGLGFLCVGLHHSLTADLHSSEYGPVGWPGRLEFINADGSLRKGHEAFNEF